MEVLHAQESLPDWTFSRMMSTVTRLKSPGNIGGNELIALTEVSKSLTSLRQRYTAKYGKDSDEPNQIRTNVTKQYAAAMGEILWSLQNLPGDPKARLTELQDIDRELRLQVTLVSQSGLGLGGLFPAVITVTVETIDSQGKGISGLWVRCNPRRYGVTSKPLFIFDDTTTPTTATLPPGSLTCWVESSDHKMLQQQPIELGTDGKTIKSIRMSIP